MVTLLKALALLFLASVVSSQTYSLFDLGSDPLETDNLYGNVAFAAVQSELESRLFRNTNMTISQDIGSVEDISVFENAGGQVPFLGDYLNPPVTPTISVSPRPSAPSLIYILMDDVGWNDVGFHDEDSSWLDFATPNMDKLSSTGIRLTQHYTGWVCGPTRASLMTGEYPYRVGYGDMPNSNAQLPLTEVTMAQELQLQGCTYYYHVLNILCACL